MRNAVPVLAAGLTLAVAADVSAAPQRYGFAFGRTGGHIRPYTVRIANTGAVSVYGPAAVGRSQLTPRLIGQLNLKSVQIDFAHLPKARSCAGSPADVAYTFIRVGSRTVRVRGACVPAYTRLWNALVRAVRLQISS
jgi:hypothetical protein